MCPTDRPARRLTLVALAVVALAAPVAAQRPAVDMLSLLNVPFFPGDGGFSARDIVLLFPPAGADVRLALTSPDGTVLHEVPFEVEPFDRFPVFADLDVNGRYGDRQDFAPGQPGPYTMSVTVDGEPVGSVSFTLAAEHSADPFAPGTRWTAEGPWRTLAHLAQRTDHPDESIGFGYWTSGEETGGRVADLSLSLRRDGVEVARSRSDFVIRDLGWRYFDDHELVHPGEGFNLAPFTAADLAAHDGRYSLVLLANDAPLKTYALTVEGGQIRPHPRSALDYEPRAGFLSPRLLKNDRGAPYTVDAWWAEAE
ncbi:MAG TPA: hypothetical protein VF576_10315 [Rubricoccaceae bacterium]|jgi:hypothetical protein